MFCCSRSRTCKPPQNNVALQAINSPTASLMGAPPTSTQRMANAPVGGNRPASAAFLSAQHERLILELLPFKDSAKFQDWLSSVWVHGSWLEFYTDFLGKSRNFTEPNKETMAQMTKDAINSKSQKYLLYNPDKTDWNLEDHHIRFMVTVIRDNLLKNLWSDWEWKKKSMDITKAVFEVLCFLKSSQYSMDQGPPRYTD